MMMSLTALTSLSSTVNRTPTNRALKQAQLAPLRAQHHSGEVWRLVNMSYGPPLATGIENVNQSLVTAQMVYPSLNGKPLNPGSTEPLDSLFSDAGGYSILTTGKDGEDYRNSVRALKAAQNSHDPYIQHQALTAQQSLEQAVADKAQNLDVTQALSNPAAFTAAQQGGMLPQAPQVPSAVQTALSSLQQPAQPMPASALPTSPLAQPALPGTETAFPPLSSYEQSDPNSLPGFESAQPNASENWMNQPSLGASALASGLMPSAQQQLPVTTNAVYGGFPSPTGQAIYTNA
jgi:hypothetical protein